MTDDDGTFPSITFPATFEGTAAIGADFSATLKLKTSNGPGVLEELKALPRGTYDVTIVSRQAVLQGDSVDREWANAELPSEDGEGIDYTENCIGGSCPHFSIPGTGELAGNYVCGHDQEAPMVVVHGQTPCPLYPRPETTEPVDETGTNEDEPGDISPHVFVFWPDDLFSSEPRLTEVGPLTRWGELVADYITAAVLDVPVDRFVVLSLNAKELLPERDLSDIIPPCEYGLRFQVSPKE